MPSLFDSESLPGSREPLQEAAVWRFDLLARGTRLTQHIVLKGENAAAYVSQVQAAFTSSLAAGMSKIVSAIEQAEAGGRHVAPTPERDRA